VREAIRADLVDVVAANDLPGTARYWLERHHLGEMVAAVGASQLDARRADAEQWVDLNRLQVRERDCHLIAHAIRAGEAQAKGMLDLLASESPRTVCAKLRDALECPLVTGERKTVWHDEVELATEANDDVSVCDRFVPIHGDVTQVARMYASALVARWPQPGTKAAAVARWLSFARVAAHSLWWDPVTDDLALAAIDAALASADCTPAAADDAHAIASDLGARLDRAHDRARDARVAAASARACGM
jgi:hypothetical protein